MENNGVFLQNNADNRKKAYFAMCKASLVLLFFAFASQLLSDVIVGFFCEENGLAQRGFVALLSFFGVDGRTSYVAAKMLFSSQALYEILSVVISLVTLVIPALIFKKCTHIRDEECFALSGKVIKWIIPMFFLCQLFTSLSSAFAQGLYSFLVPETVVAMDGAAGAVSSEFDAFEFIIRVLCSCIFVPFAEEYVFRGIVFTYLKRYGLCFAVVASASLFGVAHSFPVQSVYAFCFGIFSAFLCVVTGNIKTSLIFHGANNFITVGAGYLMGGTDEWVSGLVNAVFVMLVTALGFASLYKMFGENGYLNRFSEEARENDAALSEKCGMRELLAFPFAAYIVYYIFDVIARVLVNI